MAIRPDQAARPGHTLSLSLIYTISFLSLLLTLSCGKKSPPSLAAYEKPPAPVLTGVVHRGNNIILSWNFPEEKKDMISGFTILESSGKELQKIRVASGKLSFTESRFALGRSYTFRIVAQSLTGVLSSDSNALTITPMAPPPPPSNLSATVKDDSVMLSWDNEGKNILYNVYRRSQNERYQWQPINTAPISGNSFKDVFRIDRPVYYTVRSLRNRTTEDEGPPSREVTVNPSDLVPPAPADLRCFAAPGKVFLYWKGPRERWITGYKIYRKTDGHDYKLIGETQVPTFVDTDRASQERSYRVNAVGPSKEGPGAEVTGVFFKPDDIE